MTAAVDKATPSGMRRLFSYYRLQARLLWEWRPTRLAILVLAEDPPGAPALFRQLVAWQAQLQNGPRG